MNIDRNKSRDVTWRDVSRLSNSTARQARLERHVFRGVVTAWTGVDMFTSLFPEVVPEIDANPGYKRLNLYTREHYCFFVVRHIGTSTARHTRRVVRVVSRRDVTWGVKWDLGANTIQNDDMSKRRFWVGTGRAGDRDWRAGKEERTAANMREEQIEGPAEK